MLYAPRSLFITTRIHVSREKRDDDSRFAEARRIADGVNNAPLSNRGTRTLRERRAREREREIEERDASVVCSQTRALCGARLPGNVKHSKRQRLAAAAPSLRSSVPAPRRDPSSFVLLVRYNCRLLSRRSLLRSSVSLPRRRQARLPTRANICAGRLASRALYGARVP